MRNICIVVLLLHSSLCLFSQSLQRSANDAFLVTRMLEKYHIKPRMVDDSLSQDVFNSVFKKLDEEHVFLLKEDIRSLEPYRYELDEEIADKKTGFLQQLSALFQQRLQQSDTMIANICKAPFNFSLKETFSIKEAEENPSGIAGMRTKWYKKLKASALPTIIYLKETSKDMPAARQKKFLDSVETTVRTRIQKIYHRYIQRQLQSPGGIPQLVGEEYCKAIAQCYDPHTEYMSATVKEDFEGELGQKRMVFGFSLDEDDDGNVSVKDIAPGSPAYKSGMINKGDKITSVQWESKDPIDVSDASRNEVSSVLSTSNHAKAVITVKKADGTKRQVTLYKEQKEDTEDEGKVRSFLLKGDKTIGYILLPAFYEDWDEQRKVGDDGCANDVAKEILKLKKEKIDGLIIDLRYNGGGSVLEAIGLVGLFIDAGPVGLIKTREPKPMTLKDVNRGTVYDGPLALLVNGYSASASELVAGSLQDYNRALIIGSTTYGKATGQAIFPLDTTINIEELTKAPEADAYIKITTSQIYRLTGNTAQQTGVVPDIVLPDASEISDRKERNEPFVIQANSIQASKYWQPGKPMAIQPLKDKAALIRTNEDFTGISKYLEEKKARKIRKDISLTLSDKNTNIDTGDEDEEDGAMDEEDSATTSKPAFVIQNNEYDLQRMQTNAGLKEMNETVTRFLVRDPYLKAAYNLVLLLQK